MRRLGGDAEQLREVAQLLIAGASRSGSSRRPEIGSRVSVLAQVARGAHSSRSWSNSMRTAQHRSGKPSWQEKPVWPITPWPQAGSSFWPTCCASASLRPGTRRATSCFRANLPSFPSSICSRPRSGRRRPRARHRSLPPCRMNAWVWYEWTVAQELFRRRALAGEDEPERIPFLPRGGSRD